jgi:hypothetical protein
MAENGTSAALFARVPAAASQALLAFVWTSMWLRSRSVRKRRSPITRPVVSLHAQKMPPRAPVSSRIGLYEKVK